MAKYIKKRTVVKTIWNEGCGACDEFILKIPDIEIIFCSECKYFDSKKRVCLHESGLVDPEGDAFCSYGKEKENGK